MSPQPIVLILPAAGQGSRMGQPINKLFLKLAGSTLIHHLAERLQAFKQDLSRNPIGSYNDLWVIAVTRPQEVTTFQTCLADFPGLITAYVPGGPTRQASVRNGLKALAERVTPDTPVLIHDAARCLVPLDLLRAVAKRTAKGQACAVALPATDTVRTLDADSTFDQTLNRARIALMQTPQAAPFGQLLEAHNRAQKAVVTDDVAVLLEAGHPVTMIPGSPLNLKLTNPDDIPFAEALLALQSQKG